MRAINFNSVGSASFGLRVNGVNVFNGAAKEIQSYNVPGRPGTIIPANPVEVYANEIRQYELALYRTSTPSTSIAAIREWLMAPKSYCLLRDNYETGYYRLAVCVGEVEVQHRGAGNNYVIIVNFSCLPQRFLDTGRTWIEFETGEGTLAVNNPTANRCYPLAYVVNNTNAEIDFSVWDAGEAQTARGVATIDANSAVYFDFETTNAYTINLTTQEKVPANDLITYISGDFYLKPGQNNIIKRSSNSLGFTMQPNWWTR